MELYIYTGNKLMRKVNDNNLIVPSEKEFSIDRDFKFQPFKLNDKIDSYLVELDSFETPPDGYIFDDIRNCRKFYKEETYSKAIQAKAILNWDRTHRYCGVCGEELPSMKEDKSKLCPNCRQLLFPEIACAIIVGITKGDKLLLAHNTNFLKDRYSVIAGFVELGETLEEAVRREIKEEVNINVKNIKYFGSQSWPFPSSMMFGFTAEYESGEITPDGLEIQTGDWFSKNNIPHIPPHGSISREIIDHCLNLKENN